MKTKGKTWQLILSVLLILALAGTAFFGVKTQYGDTVTTWLKGASDIRFGVDIRGGVNVTFTASDGYKATDEQLEAAQMVIEERLLALNITDYELYIDANDSSIILEFPWKSDEADFDPEAAIAEIATTAYLTFREGTASDGELILDGAMVESAEYRYGPTTANSDAAEYYVVLNFNKEGQAAFAEATARLAAAGNGYIGIWLDDNCVSAPSVKEGINSDSAIITSDNFTADEVITMARQINSGALPFALTVDSYSTISPTLGENSLNAMVVAGVIAFALIFVVMTVLYRLPGFLAAIALLGQVAGTLAFVSGYFSVFPSFTLTLPGIAGIILAVGMGVDANVITAERIREELHSGKSLDGALKAGFQRGLAPIVDGNVTIVIVAVVLMGAFGPTDGPLARLLTPLFFAFGASTAGTIYAFGYTLLVGVLLNFVFGVFFSRVMIRGAAGTKALRNPWLYGAARKGAAAKEPKKLAVAPKRAVTIAGCVVGVILVAALVLGVRLDTRFTGGALITLGYDGDADVDAVKATVSEALEADVNLQTGQNMATGGKTLTVTLPGAGTVTVEQVEDMLSALEDEYAENGFEALSVSNVSPTMGGKFLGKSVVAVTFAMVLILLYIAVRFRNIGGWMGGLMSILALAIDLTVVFGTFVLMRSPLDGNFIAVVLTILGYSINDTVVVYDRIRENRGLMGKRAAFEDLVQVSVQQSVRRTAMTTITTVLALAVLSVVCRVYAIDSLITFVFPLMMGMFSGVFTSLFVSTSAWVLLAANKGEGGAKKA